MPISEAEFQVRGVRDPQLAAHATSAFPVWVWAVDGTHILWTNPAGAAVFKAKAGSVLMQRTFGPADQHRRQVARLVGRLALNGATRLERLRGFGMSLGLLVTCACARLAFTGGGSGILIAAVEPVGRALAYDERVQRLIDDIDTPIAAFTCAGDLVSANESAKPFMTSLDVMGTSAAMRDENLQIAVRDGHTEFVAPIGHVLLQRVGQGADTTLLAFITPAAVQAWSTVKRHEVPKATVQTAPEAAGLPQGELQPLEHHETSVTATSIAPIPDPDDTPRDDIAIATSGIVPASETVVDRREDITPSTTPVSMDVAEQQVPETELSVDPAPAIEAAPARPINHPAEDDNAAIDTHEAVEMPAPSARPPADHPPPLPERRHPLRFMWQMDSEGRFSLGSDEFSRLIGPRTATAFGRPWREVSALFGIDPEGRVAAAVATRNTWSGITIDWPADGTGSHLPVELSGLPVYDKARQFLGYRGFGVCRDLEGLTRLAVQRQNDTLSPDPAFPDHNAESMTHISGAASLQPVPAAIPYSMQTKTDTPVDTPQNIVPFPATTDPKAPTLTAIENNAFNELARQLAERLNAEQIDRDARNKAAETPHEQLANADQRSEHTPRGAEIESAPVSPADTGAQELGTILDATGDGILIFDTSGRIVTCNRSAETMFGFGEQDIVLRNLTELFTPADHASVLDYFANTRGATTDQPSREVRGRTRNGETVLLSLTIGRTLKNGDRFFAICRQLSQTHRSEADLRQTQRQADRAAHARSDILARISHEVRTPLSAIIGFSDIMIEERFGALGNERYAAYMKDIRAAGERVLAIVNDLLDLSRIETGKLDLTFARQDLNDMVEQCVAAMQPRANRERIIIRTSLAHALPHVTADAGSLRQIVMSLVGNSIQVARAGGQVIVSTALTDLGDVVLRVRDTGRSLNYSEMEAALEQFRNPASEQLVQDNAAISLSLTKALVEANQAQFQIKSAPQSGTLVEIAFSAKTARAI